MGKVAKTGGTAVIRWQDEMANAAKAVAEMEQHVGGGNFFGTKSGQLTFGGQPVPGNRMGVIILDHILENVFYEGRFDPDAVSGPTCFAFGRVEKEMTPHEVVINKQADACDGCPQNEWASSDTGKGKACKNSRRLAVIAAGTFDKNGEFHAADKDSQLKGAAIGYLKLPVTSTTGYATYVKQLAGVLKRPPFGVMTCVELVPDGKTQFKITFSNIQEVSDDLMGVVWERVQEAKAAIEFPYSPADPEAVKKPAKQQAKAAAFKGAAKFAARR